MSIAEIPLCHFIDGLRAAHIPLDRVLPASNLHSGRGSCQVMVQNAVAGNGAIGIPIVEYQQSGDTVEVGMRNIYEDGRVVDLIRDPSLMDLVRQSMTQLPFTFNFGI